MSVLEYQNPKDMSSERIYLKERVFLTSRIRDKITCEFFDNAFSNISESHEDVCKITWKVHISALFIIMYYNINRIAILYMITD